MDLGLLLSLVLVVLLVLFLVANNQVNKQEKITLKELPAVKRTRKNLRKHR